jgi:hypothetical protein
MFILKPNQRLLVLVLAFVLVFPSMQIAQKVKISEKDGVTIVKNPKKPVHVKGAPSSLIMEEDLCLGDVPSEDYMFEELRSLHVDKDEDMIVLDWGSDTILVFDKQGRFIRSFGRHGQGPGELSGPSRMYIKGGQDICIMDSSNNRIAYYSKQGECLREIQMAKHRVFRTIPDSRGYIYGDNFSIQKSIKYQLIKLDSEFKLLQVVAEFERPLNRARGLNPMLERFVYTVLPNDFLAWAVTTEYAIHFVDPMGKHIRTVQKDYKQRAITEKEQERIIKETYGDESPPAGRNFIFPKHFNPMRYFICDDLGRIYVRTYSRMDNDNIQWDVFDEEGRYILSFFHPGEDLILDIQKNKAYAMIQANEEGLPLIKRYRMRWQ